MKDFTGVDTVYVKKLQTVQLKLEQDFIADPAEEDKHAIEKPDEIYEILKSVYKQLDDDQEHMVMLVLNIANEVTGFKVISSGTQSSGPADGKIIFRAALMLGASKIILAHNHPSGQLKPSKSDIRITEKLIKVGDAIGIPLIDHLIVTHRGYLSFRAEQLCDFPPFA